MKSYPVHVKIILNIFLYTIFIAIMLTTFAGCSGGNDSAQASTAQSEIDQLREENEKLRKELEAAAANSEMQAGNESEPVEYVPTSIVPPKQDPIDSLIGEWFLQKFHEDGIFSWTQSMIFYADGSGTMNRTYYVPKDNTEELPDFDSSLGLSWDLEGEVLHLVLENGESADFEFSFVEQTLSILSESTNPDIYARERPSGLDQYVERSLFTEDLEAKEALRKRRFIGNWYFDVLVWTFNEDGTGVIDIPKLGDQPATKQEFSYTIYDDSSDSTYVCLVIDWDDSRTSYFYPTFNADGSMTFEMAGGSDSLTLTRTFDIDNCPISEAIIANQMGVFTGSIFSEILPEL